MGVVALEGAPYLVLVYVHVVAAIVWLGTGFSFHHRFAVLRRSGDNATLIALGREAEALGPRLFAPASGVVLLMGILMVAFGPYGAEVWIWLALAGFALTFATGLSFIGPASARVAEAAERDGVDAPTTVAAIRRLTVISRLDYLVLMLIVLDMVFKPGA